jgi:crotonobetainyl-CoA:carnitine CoA-transferase CaiB-like acyl-CoA transferase
MAVDKILEVGGIAAGFAGRVFAQTGYDVVRIEGNGYANDNANDNANSPAWVSDHALDLFLHSGKRRIATDDPDLIAELAAQADIVILEAASADAVLTAGFDHWTCPVKVAITPFGRTGPRKNWRGTENVLQAMGGYSNLIGDQDIAPLTLPGHYVDLQSGQWAYMVANACRLGELHEAADISKLEVVMSLSQFTTVQWHCANNIRSRHGNDFWWVCPSTQFKLADGWAYINIVPTFWDPFTTFLGRPELVLDERFLTNGTRMANREALHEIISVAMASMTRAEVEESARDFRVPIGVVQTFDDILSNAHLAERDFWQALKNADAPEMNAVQAPPLPFRFNDKPWPTQTLTPVESQVTSQPWENV